MIMPKVEVCIVSVEVEHIEMCWILLIKRRPMINDKETEADYLLSYLESVAFKINKSGCSFRSSVDRSGLILQLHISEK